MRQYIDKYRHILKNLTDVRVIGQAVFVLIVLIMSWNGIGVIHTNYKLQQQIARIQQENEIQKLKNENQKLKNEYYNSPQYLELAARQNFGLAVSGEKELLVPKDVALAHLPENIPDEPSEAIANDESKTPTYKKNLQAWLNFFFHREPEAN